jgi:hypothetical protein
MLTTGKVINVKATSALLKQAGRMRTSLPAKASIPTGCAVRHVTLEPFLSFRDDETASAPPATTNFPSTSGQTSQPHSTSNSDWFSTLPARDANRQ